jgi:hypothetical protein
MDNPQVTETTRIAWLSSMIDGEGCVNVHFQKPEVKHLTPAMVVTNSDPRIIATFADILTQLGIGHHVNTYPKKNHLPVVQVAVRGAKRCLPLFKLIRPYLVSKGEEVDVLIKLIESRLSKKSKSPVDEYEISLVQQCKDLKRIRHLRDFVPSSFYSKDEDKVHTVSESAE